MKLVNGKTSLALRLGALVAALLLGQQAMAAGTRAGTDIDNTVNVNYEVGGIGQTALSDSVSFKVDRRVDYTLTLLSTPDLEPVSPGQNGVFVDFLLTNTSNSDLDFTLALAQAAGVDVDSSGTDNADMATIDYAVSADVDIPSGGTDPDPVRTTGPQYIDGLLADQAIRIRVWGDAALTMLDGQIAGAELTATAVELSGTEVAPGLPLAYGGANGDLTIENVDPNGTDGVRVAVDGFLVQAAQLSVVKAYSVIDDGFGGTVNPLPGAEVEYTITITNTSTTTAADNVVITDTLDTDLAFLPDWSTTLPAGNDMELSVNGGAATGCTEDAADDSCERSGQNLTFNVASISANGSLVVTYRVTILDPAATP